MDPVRRLRSGLHQGLSDFGSALVALVALLGLVVSIVNLLRHRNHLQLTPLYPLFVGALLGIAPGVLFLARVPQAWVMLGLGLMQVVFATISLAPGQRKTHAAIRSGLLMGLASGVLGGPMRPMVHRQSCIYRQSELVGRKAKGSAFRLLC